MIERIYDAEDGVIRVNATDRLTAADVAEHFIALRKLIAELRAKERPVRVLVDIRQLEKQLPAIEAFFGLQKKHTYRRGDRVAILASSTEHKDHIRSLLKGGEIWCWESELAAEQWLTIDGAQIFSDIVRKAG